MRSFAFVCLTLLLAACAAREDHAPGLPSVAVLEPTRPMADALAEVDPRPFVPLTDVAAPRWFGDAAAGARLAELGVARFVEPVSELSIDFVPSDPKVRDQWGLADIEAPRAWDRAPSARGVVVAVVDSGVFLSHPDLASAVWTNEGEVPDNGLDDDDNGFVDDVHGWDFVEQDADPSPGGTDPYSSHGTHVAGIIGAVSDNGRGVSGVAPGVLVMPVRVMAGRSGRSDWIADGIDYAVANGARVVNLSLGGSYSRLIDEAIARAWRAGVVVVAAAGNEGAGEASFPASSQVPGVLGVAATDRHDELANFSNFGPGVDLTAPGVDILSTFGPRSYKPMSGTSMAAPHVSGALALRLASRGKRTDKDLTALLDALPRGVQGVPRLDLAAMVEPASPDAARRVTSRRTRVSFHAGTSHRRPPPQRIALEAVAQTAFDLDASDWVHPGPCRVAPCLLTVSVDPSDLGYGAHTGSLVVRPKDGTASLALDVEVFVGADRDAEVRVEAEVDGRTTEVEDTLSIGRGSTLVLRLVREGRRSSARWSVDGLPYAGSELQGTFAREGSYMVRAADDAGRPVVIPVEVTTGGQGAAAGVGVPHGG